MKKFLITLFIFSSLIFPSIMSVNIVSASAEQVITFDNVVKYHYFSEPYSIAANDRGVAVYDNDNIVLFDNEYNLINTTEACKNTVKIKYYGDILFSLTDIGIFKDNLLFAEGTFVDFCCSENLLYAASESQIYIYMIDSPNSKPTIYDIKAGLSGVRYSQIEAIAVKNTLMYISVPGHINKNFSDVYQFDAMSKVMTLVYRQQQKITSLLYDGQNLFGRTENAIIRFDESMGELLSSEVYENSRLIDFCRFNEMFYILDMFGTIKTVNDFGETTTLIASASDSEGFYNMPVSILTKNNSIIVSDFFNNRIAIFGKDGFKYIQNISRPTGAAIDNYGNIFVANESNKISVYNSLYEKINEITMSYKIKNICSDSFNNVFVIAENHLYIITSEATEIKVNIAINDIFSNANNGKTYLSSESGIYQLTFDNATWNIELFSEQKANRFVVDDNEQIIVLNDNILTAYVNQDTITIPLTNGSDYITISTIKNDYVDYGDLLTVNPITHSVNKIPYSEVGIVSIAHDFTMPNINSPTPNKMLSDPIIGIIENDTPLFSAPYDSEIKANLKRGQRIIIDHEKSTSCFSLVLFSDPASRKLIYGYIYNEAISDLKYSYTLPATQQTIVYNDNTPIYKYPSVFSATLKKVQKNDTVDLLSFAAINQDRSISDGYFLDDLDYKWFRVALDNDAEGYIIASDLTNNDLFSKDLYPQINGSIIEHDGKSATPLYSYDNLTGQYVPMGENITAGTRIEILDLPFDPTVKYCKILYYKDGYGSVECYVLSDFVKYNSKNSAQYIAIIIIVCCLILGICTFVLIRHIKNRRLLK